MKDIIYIQRYGKVYIFVVLKKTTTKANRNQWKTETVQ